MCFKQGRTTTGVACVLVAVLAALLLFTPVAGNLWGLLTDGGPMSGGGFELPAESSVFTFRATEMNHGSGEWWLYAEDNRHYYAAFPSEGVNYVAFPKSEVARCPTFQARDSATWCREGSVMHEAR